MVEGPAGFLSDLSIYREYRRKRSVGQFGAPNLPIPLLKRQSDEL
jgi:hypothetical protein